MFRVWLGIFWKYYIGKAGGGMLVLMVLILLYIKLPQMPKYYLFNLKMATAMFAKHQIIFNIQHSSSPKTEVVHQNP
jgi:hypothetical protein